MKMKKIATTLLVASLSMPIVVQAGGIGLYIPYSVGQSIEQTYSYDNLLVSDVTFKDDVDNNFGIGFAYDSNLGKDKSFNYRLGLEYMPRKINGSDEGVKYSVINTFGFSIFRADMVRVWAGPRINIGYDAYDKSGFSRNGMEIGIAPVVGVNVNFGDYFALSFDVDYKYSAVVGGFETVIDTGTYTGTETGATARLTAFYRFGEDFEY
jgi:hypothetical protein